MSIVFSFSERFVPCHIFVLFLAMASTTCWYWTSYMSCCQTPSGDQELLIQANSSRSSLLYKALGSDHFNAATRTNRVGQSLSISSACVLDPAIIDCNNMGLASFVLLTLEHISLCHELGSSQVTVFWRACYFGCSKDPDVNSWEWYFEPVNPGIETRARKVLCLNFAEDALIEQANQLGTKIAQPILSNSFGKRSNISGFDKGSLIDSQERYRVNQWISQYVKPNERIREKVDNFYQRHMAGYNLVGVHVRGTDHWMETHEKKLPALSRWIRNAAVILESLPHPRKLFVASDNDETIFVFEKHFGKENVVSTEAFRSSHYRGQAVHSLALSQGIDPQMLGTQVLMDILLLAKCDHFLHAESSVAALAAYFNPHMKSHFLEEITDKEKTTEEEKQETVMLEEEELDEEELDEKELDEEELDEEEFASFAACFKGNSPNSACPNSAKGIFVDAAEAQAFLTEVK